MHYATNIVYNGSKLDHILISEGRVRKEENSFKYEYFLKDHLGNVRVVFGDDGSGNAEVLQEDHYYPYGMTLGGLSYNAGIPHNKYQYNGKEIQSGHNLDWYAYGFRMMDPQLGRWHVVDAMAENYISTSPYAYVKNDPINYIDLLGLSMQAFDKHNSGGEGWWTSSMINKFPMNAYQGGGTNGNQGGGSSGSQSVGISGQGHYETYTEITDWYQIGYNSAGEVVSIRYLDATTAYNTIWIRDESGIYVSAYESGNQSSIMIEAIPMNTNNFEKNNSKSSLGGTLVSSRGNLLAFGILLSAYIIDNWEEIREMGYVIGENISDYILEFTPTNDLPSNPVFGDKKDHVTSRELQEDWFIQGQGGDDLNPSNLGPGGAILLYGKLFYEMFTSWQDATKPQPPPPPPGINNPQ